MKTLSKLMLAGAITLGLGATALNANAVKGQKLFIKKYKDACGFNGAIMAAKHTQDEWEAINDSGKVADEIMKFCPNVKKVKGNFVPHMYDFFYKYASDSGNVPSC